MTPADDGREEAERPGPRHRVELVIDGERTPIRAFLHDVIGGAVSGMIAGLQGGDEASRIELRIERRRPASDDLEG